MAMKATATWEYWVIGVVTAFIIISLYIAFSPVINDLSDIVAANSNFTHAPTNTSLTNTNRYNNNMWNAWPIAAIVLVFVLLINAASEEEDRRFPGLRGA